MRGKRKRRGNYKKRFGKENLMYKHGMTNSRPFRIWVHMKSRCNRPNDDAYKAYGGRGIKICSRWNDAFTNFWKDMGESYFDGATIERIDNNGNYSPENCRWIPLKEQAKNKRTTKYITYRGITKTTREWSEFTGINYQSLKTRFRRNWSPEKALSANL